MHGLPDGAGHCRTKRKPADSTGIVALRRCVAREAAVRIRALRAVSTRSLRALGQDLLVRPGQDVFVKHDNESAPVLACGRHRLALDRPRVMGILNVTPDSFSDGGRFLSPARAIERAWAMRDQGVDVIDIGGESTRPGALPVSEGEEIDRVLPVLAALAQ